MNKHVFLSILAMDSYNRGYNQGVFSVPDASGIGTATVLAQSSILANSNEVAQGFYAIAYKWNGSTILSYRGTDPSDGANAVKDIINGWSSFSGLGTNK
jgi:hypothetical protein